MRTFRLTGLGLLLATLAVPLLAYGDDWPQWQGPSRDAISKEKGLLKEWPKEKGPALAWTFEEAGVGFSAPAVVGDRVYIPGSRNGTEFVIALDAANGKEVWAAKIGPEYPWKNQWNEGPQAAPSVDGDLLYAVGSQGLVVCVNLKDKGKEVWRKDMVKDLGGHVDPVGGGGPEGWGYAGSPLVDGDQVIVTPGGEKGLLAALDKKTGATKWQSKDVPVDATYSSPIVVEVGGVRQYIAMTGDGCVGVDAKTGGQLWRYKRVAPYNEIVAPTPIFHENQVLITAWKGGPELIKLEAADKKFTATKVYGKNTLANEHGGVVLLDGFIYGAHQERGWRCVEFKTGAQKWDTTNLGYGSVTCADGKLYCYTQDEGEVALVEPSSEEFKEISRFTIPKTSVLAKRKLSGRIWTHPVIANGYLYLRDQELLFCYKVK